VFISLPSFRPPLSPKTKRDTEQKVVEIRSKATSGANEGLLETSTDLSASLRQAENTLAKFNEMRFGRPTAPIGTDDMFQDAALTMELDALEQEVNAFVKEADECEEFQNKAIAAMKQERLDRLNNIRNKFESGGKSQASFKELKPAGRNRSKTTLT
jgi:flagellar biosynthesis/type III secretory pathway protein FliH